MGDTYNKITNPETGRKVNVNSTLGKKILKNYLNNSQLGGIHKKPVKKEESSDYYSSDSQYSDSSYESNQTSSNDGTETKVDTPKEEDKTWDLGSLPEPKRH